MSQEQRAQMDERVQTILMAIVAHYIGSGEPVGSRTLSKHLDLGLSSATIRNVMADLTDQGYLEQPHTSAGRIPTDKAYRFFVDAQLDQGVLPKGVKAMIDETVKTSGAGLEGLLTNTGKLLAELTSATGVVGVPRFNRARLRKIEFIKIDPRHVYAVMVTRSNMVHSRLIEISEDLPQNFLTTVGLHLTAQFENRFLADIRRSVLSTLVEERDQYDQLLAHAARLSKKAFDFSEDSDLYVEGQVNLVNDFTDIEKVKRLLRALEEKIAILDTLDQALDTSGLLHVYIGLENRSGDLQDCAVVTAKYGFEGTPLGALGVIGPTRMDYVRVIPIIDYTAKMLSQAITEQ